MSYYAGVKVIFFVVKGQFLIGIVKHKSNSQIHVERRVVHTRGNFSLFHPMLLSFFTMKANII